MARRKAIDILDAIDPRNFLPNGYDEELEEDDSPITPESLAVFTFLFRLMEQWKYLPVEVRDGGIIRGGYMGSIDNENEVAEQVILLLERRFGKGRKVGE